jgi:1,4-alpha-glucan branching enzyme
LSKVIHGPTLFTDHDIYLFKEGNHFQLYEKLGSHLMNYGGTNGVYFALWAPNAKYVSVVGDFNSWDTRAHPLSKRWDSSGIYEGFIPGVENGTTYKYFIISNYNNQELYKFDPYSFFSKQHPSYLSVVWDLKYDWNDQEWMRSRNKYTALNAPYSIYEVHLGSWRKKNGEINYRKIADELINYVKELEFTFVEFLPLQEHPFYGSWGYQCTGYFAPTSRFGNPQDLMYMIDSFHKNGIGVIFDWAAAHFPSDAFALSNFDGTNLYEHADPRKGFHPDWNTLIFNYSRNEVKEFLISSAFFWFDKYHVDAVRVDAVASMLYLNYSRKEGEWIRNKYGGNENLEAIAFIRSLNSQVYQRFPDVQLIAEESTAWPMVSRPIEFGGLGFGMKWNLGWMHDTLKYMSLDPIFRKFHHNQIVFSILYAFHENFVLALSHDETVFGKGSFFAKMPGDQWQKYANFRLLLGYLFTHPGKKLMFMGTEFAMSGEWNHDTTLPWDYWNEFQKKVFLWVKALNNLYRTEKILYEYDFKSEGFEWLDWNDFENSVLSFIRKGSEKNEMIAVFCNFTPICRDHYRIGIPLKGKWKKLLNSDDLEFLGSGYNKNSELYSENIPSHGRSYSLSLNLSPLAIMIYKFEG